MLYTHELKTQSPSLKNKWDELGKDTLTHTHKVFLTRKRAHSKTYNKEYPL